jgi:hypothetical protein
MDLLCAPCWVRLRAVVIVGLVGFLWECHAGEVQAQTPGKAEESEAAARPIRDVRSRHFLVHTDLSPGEADDFVERLETMLGQISTYWGRPMRGVIECYVVRNLCEFPVATMAPVGVREVKTAGGVTLMQITREGKRQVAKSVTYASARLEVVQHEAVHAYCHQTFGRVGAVWYSEGMAEMGRFWRAGDSAVRAEPREIEFLRSNPPKSLAEPLSPAQVTGDSWQNYASRWALCHFLASNPNYSRQFRQLGRGLLAGKDVSFEQTYGAMTRQLTFEYLLFLEHIGRGYRVDLCAWDWKKKFARLQPGRVLTATIAAGRGWQPAGLTVRSGTQYEYLASGTWQITGEPENVDANGDDQGRGRLVGVVMKDYRLGAEFELGAKGSFQLEVDGDLYLRCRDAWNELDDDLGYITVKLQLQGQVDATCN